MLTMLLTLAIVLTHADDFTKIEYQVTPLVPGVSMLEGAGGNITALTGPEGTLLIDDDFAPMAEKLVARLKTLGGESPRYIVNTHFHYDHTGANANFGQTATLIAATRVRERLMTEQRLWGENHPAAKPSAWPVLTFDQSLTLHLNGEDIRLRHLSHGHTDGDTIAYFTHAHVLSLGDLYFAGMFPIFHPEHGGSLKGYIENLELILKDLPPDVKIVPGHGALSGLGDLKLYVAMIRASIATVHLGLQHRRTLAQIQKQGLGAKWQRFANGYLTSDQWLQLVYKELAPK